MIRREMSLPSDDGVWALISQVEHARLAADLARYWRDPLVPPVRRGKPNAAIPDELLAAIEHHDDGWAEWEEAPELDPEHGRPRSFMEMPQADSLAIWSKSIAVAEQIGPLAAWVVAGHFAALLKVGQESSSDEARLAREWNDLIRSRRAAWLRNWLDPAASRTQEVAESALRSLQFFDAASLWICCTCPSEGAYTVQGVHDAVLTFVDGAEYRFCGRHRDAAAKPRPPAVRPWPFAVDRCRLAVDCLLAPVRRYTRTDELLHASQPHRLAWQLGDDRST